MGAVVQGIEFFVDVEFSVDIECLLRGDRVEKSKSDTSKINTFTNNINTVARVYYFRVVFFDLALIYFCKNSQVRSLLYYFNFIRSM